MSKSDMSSMADGLAVKGFFAVVFGVAAVFWPHLTLGTLVYLFSGYILAMGVLSLIGSFSGAKSDSMGTWLMVLVALVEVCIGVYLFRHPAVSFSTLILLAAIVLIVRGLFTLVAPFLMDGMSSGNTLGMLLGLVSVVAVIVLLFQPSSSGVAFVWILGIYALVTGPLLLALSKNVRES